MSTTTHPSQQPGAGDLIATREAAEILGVRSATVTRWHRSGVLLAVQKLPGATGALLFDRDDVVALARARGEAGGPSLRVVDDAPVEETSYPDTWVCPECGQHVRGGYTRLRAHRRIHTQRSRRGGGRA